MKKLLILMPSRKRPQRMKEAVQSYLDTTDGTHSEIRVIIDGDDPTLDEYLTILNGELDFENVSYVIGKPSTYTNIVNREFENDKHRNFYCLTNDDIIYKTNEWDKLLSVDWAITTGYEPNMHEFHGDKTTFGFPIISVIDGRIIRELGWLQYPKLNQCCGDNVWYMLGTRCENLLYNKNVIYVHNHAYFGKAEMDEHYHKILDNNAENAKKDFKIYMNWLKYDIPLDTLKIKNLIRDNNGKFSLKSKIKTP